MFIVDTLFATVNLVLNAFFCKLNVAKHYIFISLH